MEYRNIDALSKNLTDKEAALEGIKKGVLSLRFVSRELRGDKDIVLEAVKRNSQELKYASPDLRDDKEVVLAAGTFSLEWLDKLRDDKDIVLMAIRRSGYQLKYASEKLKGDKDVVLEAIKQTRFFGDSILECASDELKKDKTFISKLVKYNAEFLRYASEELSEDKAFVLKLIKQYGGYVFRYAGYEPRRDKKIAIEAVKRDSDMLEYVDKELREDKEFMAELALKCPDIKLEKESEIIDLSKKVGKYKSGDLEKIRYGVERKEELTEQLEAVIENAQKDLRIAQRLIKELEADKSDKGEPAKY